MAGKLTSDKAGKGERERDAHKLAARVVGSLDDKAHDILEGLLCRDAESAKASGQKTNFIIGEARDFVNLLLVRGGIERLKRP